MQITVFGSSGKVGRLVVEQLLGEGHSVVAFVHHNVGFTEHPKLTIIKGDVHGGDAIATAVVGSDAVISALGSWHTPEKNILSSAMERLIPAMRASGIKRVISLTGAGAFAPHDHSTIFDKTGHALLNGIAPKILRDGEEHIRLLSESGLDWTVVRAPVMVNGGGSEYRLTEHFPMPWATIHRLAVANCMVDLLSDTTHYRSAPFITRR